MHKNTTLRRPISNKKTICTGKKNSPITQCKINFSIIILVSTYYLFFTINFARTKVTSKKSFSQAFLRNNFQKKESPELLFVSRYWTMKNRHLK